MRDVHWLQALESVYRVSYHSLPIRGPIAASFMDDTHEIEEEANASTNAPLRQRQALADSMMKSMTASVSKLESGDPPTIYKVPQSIRQVKMDAYEPKIVSIGPYHHGKKRLKGMEEHKWRYLDSILSGNRNHRLEAYLEEMEKLENKVRSCYSDNVGRQMGDKGNEFVKMMVLDGCFIVGFFLKLRQHIQNLEKHWREQLPQKGKDLSLKQKELSKVDPLLPFWLQGLIVYDMILLENQIPFFVLQSIFEMACPGDAPHLLAQMALDFFHLFFYDSITTVEIIPISDSIHHLLHLFHLYLIQTPPPSKQSTLSCNLTIKSVANKWKNLLMFLLSKCPKLPISNSQSSQSRSAVPWKLIPCAAELQLSGVKFKKKEVSSGLWDVTFSHGVLEIPPLLIHYYTDAVFRSLIAFEQCCPEAIMRFTTYVNFLNRLVNTSEDVALLHRNGIITHLLGSDEDVAHILNRLSDGSFDYNINYLTGLYEDVEKHRQTKWNMWQASLKRDYFTNPWSVISLIAASILLLVTITQTIFTVLPYYHRSPSS